MIKRIELINFMSHQHTVIEPSAGLTVLIGPNNCGKSAIVTALQILCSNPKSTYVLRHGTKECKIILETDAGDVIQWSRKKSGSPKYVINGELFDRLKGKVPEPLHKILRMPQVQVDKESFDVHFGEQTTPLFLLGDKEKAAAQFFASSSDAIRLVEMQDRHKSNIKIRKSDLKRITKQRESLIAENVLLNPVLKLHAQAVQCETFATEIQQQKQRLQNLEQVVTAIEKAQQRCMLLEEQTKVLTVIPAVPNLQPTQAITTTIDAIEVANRDAEVTQSKLDALQDLVPPPQIQPTDRLTRWLDDWRRNETAKHLIDRRMSALAPLVPPPEIAATDSLRVTIDRLVTHSAKQTSLQQRAELLQALPAVPQIESTERLGQLIHQYDQLLSRQRQQAELQSATQASLAGVEAEIEKWLQSNPQCPTCGTEVTKQQLLGKTGGHVHAR